jgi:hypothetical protein
MTIREPKVMILSLALLTCGVYLFSKMRTLAQASDSRKDALVDAMSEQSFPASDAPAY